MDKRYPSKDRGTAAEKIPLVRRARRNWMVIIL
jgi:hypothetical protein